MARVLFLPLFVIFVTAEARTKTLRKGGQPVTPKLTPESPSKFLGDYTADRQPGVGKKFAFDHPYPAVQDTEHFDTDYVNDENGDGGKWAAQFQYDTLRTAASKEEKKLKVAEEKAAEEKEELVSAKKKEEAAAADAATAEKALDKAKEKENALSKEVDELEGNSKDGGKKGGSQGGKGGEKATEEKGDAADVKTGGKIADATAKVEKEMQDLEDCKKSLEQAKAKTKKLKEDKEKLVEKEKADAQVEEAKKKEALESATAEESKAEAQEEVLSKNETIIEAKVKEEKAEFDEAKKDYEHKVEDLDKTEAELQRVTKELSKHRHAGVDQDGGVYYSEDGKSGASKLAMPAGAAWLTVAVAAAVSCHAA
mmetsp:Transcript_94492/g.163402  ORF Transcript_94492/g.163402 Transcript_94492/m.163402 type:complete len:368 (-) Transcript_94492:41-1144(-)